MPSVIARDSVAADHLVYAWPFPIGPEECEVACSEDELVVMCPAWVVGNTLGPGRHRWRTPDPMRPVAAFFVLTAPVEVSFDMVTMFVIPTTGQPVRLRASGSLQVRCTDPSLLVAQFVGLPFDSVNEGIVRSVQRSVERMLARLLTRRVVMAGTPMAVTDPGMQSNIVEELVAYNPAAGAVFGVELVRMGHLTIYADDGSQPFPAMPRVHDTDTQRQPTVPPPPHMHDDISLVETARSRPGTPPPAPPAVQAQGTPPPAKAPGPPVAASGEIVVKNLKETVRGHAPSKVPTPPPGSVSASTPPPPPPQRVTTTPPPPTRRTPQMMEVSGVIEERADAGRASPSAIKIPPPPPIPAPPAPAAPAHEARGAILGIGTGAIGEASSGSVVSGEIQRKVAPGARVLVPGPNGLMQSATVRQLLQGYYELEVGSSGETIWVPINGVVPE